MCAVYEGHFPKGCHSCLRVIENVEIFDFSREKKHGTVEHLSNREPSNGKFASSHKMEHKRFDWINRCDVTKGD